ncbi:MAG TPA: HAMP domain-containing sensor histidine kinase [Gaiellaceae bacterium]|nr:HAMP domain-containing sensor histidine kinase [Gaiellaceae bacterium]
MRRVITTGSLRRRLAVTYAIVAAVATGALALGTYLLVATSRLDESVSSSLAQARTNLVLAGAVLGESSAPRDVADLLEFYARRADFETVALAGGEEFPSSFAFGTAQIPDGVRRLVQDGDLAFERVTVDDTPYLVAGGRPPPSQAEFYFFFSEELLRQDLARLRTILLTGWGIVVILSAAAGAIVARRVLRPVAQASAAAHALAEGLLETRLPVETDDELGAWATSFNEMAQALEEKIHALSEAQARERRFTSDVAHELRTPVTALAGEASLLSEHLERMPLEARRPAQLLVEDVRRLRRLVEELMEISRLDAGREDVRTEAIDLGSLAAGLIRSRGWDTSVSLEAQPVVVETDPRRAERILSNLIENAVAHGGSEVAVRVGGLDDTAAFVEIQDHGPGIAPDHLAHVFERFYKADPARAGGGSGLGLAIAFENARLLGGRIDAQSEVGVGSCFTLKLPVAKPLLGGTGPDADASEDVVH